MLDLSAIGVESEPVERQWDERDVLLYAVAVGAGQDDPTEQLQLTTENSDGVVPVVLPTFANLVVGGDVLSKLGPYDRSALLHASQDFTLHRPLPLCGTARSSARIIAVYDKGAAAVVVIESNAVDTRTGELLVTTRRSAFIRGEGGFGGDRGPAAPPGAPDARPDLEIDFTTAPSQALLYRLTGDRNPLHSDPVFARRGGFSRPILHGMCTYGYVGRLLFTELCGSDPTRFSSMGARFTSTVLPGETLTLQAWDGAGAVQFRVVRDGVPVLDSGTLKYRAAVSSGTDDDPTP